MSSVFVSVGMSLDGFIAGPNGGPTNGGGVRLFDRVDRDKLGALKIVEAIGSPAVTHLRYSVR